MVARLVSADSDSGKLPDVVLYDLGTRLAPLTGSAEYAPATGSTAYAPIASAAIDPAAYGAKGDGSTDDTTAIKNALAAGGATKTVRLRAGMTYVTSSLITLPAGATLEGYGATVKASAAVAAFNMFTVGSTGGSIRGLTLDLNKANVTNSGTPLTGVGIYISSNGWANFELRDVRVQNGHQYGIYLTNFNGLTDAALAAEHQTTFSNVTVDACGYGMGFGKFGGLRLTNCYVSNSTAGSGVYLSLMRDPQVIGCTSRNNTGSGIFFDYVYQGTIVGNNCYSNTMHGLVFGGGAPANASSREFVAVGNTCRKNGDCGITCDPTKSGSSAWQPQYGVLSGNVVESNGRAGIQLENSAYMSVTGNVSRLNGQVVSTTGFGIRAQGAHHTINGNVCTGNAAYGIGLLGNSSTPDTGYHRVGVNKVAGNTGGTYLVGDTMADMKFAATQATPND